MNELNQTGGLVSIPVTVMKVFVTIGRVIVRIISYIITRFGPMILKFLLFCVLSSFALGFFGFFGIIFTFIGVIVMYTKLFGRIAKGK